MFLKNSMKLLVPVSLVLLIGFSAVSRPRKMQRLSQGTWGGSQIRVNVEQTKASIDYVCAHGTINGPLTFDSKGRFTWRGTHSSERPGPIRLGQDPDSQSAIYSGSIKGDTITLTVRLEDSKEVLGTFTLKRGVSGRVFRCR